MKYNKQIKKIIKDNNGIITNKEWEKNNIPRIYLTRMVKEHRIKKIARGIYISENTDYDDDYFFQLQFRKCVYSFQSALYYHQLTDRVPFQKEVTLYKGYNPHRIPSNTKLHFSNKEIYKLGITNMKTIFGNDILVYDKEKTICDLIKNRKYMDVEIFKEAIKKYITTSDKDINLLYKYAALMNIENQVNALMEVIY